MHRMITGFDCVINACEFSSNDVFITGMCFLDFHLVIINGRVLNGGGI